MVWAKNGTPSTLGSAGDTCEITDLTAKKFNVFLFDKINTGNANTISRFNANSSTVYANRYSQNGGADDATLVSSTSMETNFVDTPEFMISYVCSIGGEEKLVIRFIVHQSTAGAGTAPGRLEMVHKFVPSPDADITGVNYTNTAAGSFDTNTNASALGTD